MENEFDKKYPEHAKLKEIKNTSQKIGEFLNWTNNRGMFLAEYATEDLGKPPVIIRSHKGINMLLGEFFGIDLDKLEDEKLEILKTLNEKS